MSTRRQMLGAWLVPALIAAATAFCAAIAAAVVIAIADIYVTGHGGASLTKPWLTWGSVVDLSPADMLLWSATLIAGAAAFFLTRRRPAR